MNSHQPSPRMAPVAMMGHPSAEQPRVSIESEGSPDLRGVANNSPETRSLPPRDVDAANIEDRYVQFIFYCNPSIPSSKDTTELRKGLQSLPRTDGKTFQVFTLFELVRKLEEKEIETWSQLVVVMGVEPPDISKNQSTQKVQQYAVRLKRWLHAFHIDAYFQYLLAKPNSYYTEIPIQPHIAPTTIRDGVPPEEDLALRALLPEWRPKRGRRKLEHGEDDLAPNAKRSERASSLVADSMPSSQSSAISYPQSAFPWDRQSNQSDPWAAAQRAILPRPQAPNGAPPPHLATPPQQARAHAGAAHHTFWVDLPDATTPYPQSAIDAMPHPSAFTPHPGATPSEPAPQSAHPLSNSSPRPRKRHGPSVSAAWPRFASTSGKLRGRPPTNRSVQDGPYSTFPSRPIAPAPGLSGTDSPTPTTATAPDSATAANAEPSSAASASSEGARRPSKLSLQVPQSTGRPVRLATPPPLPPPPAPPKVLVNGGETAATTVAAAGGPVRPHDTPASATPGSRKRPSSRSSLHGANGGGRPPVPAGDFFAPLPVEARSDAGVGPGVWDDDEDALDADGLGSLDGSVDGEGGEHGINWKRRAMALKRKLVAAEAELRAVKRRVMEAVM